MELIHTFVATEREEWIGKTVRKPRTGIRYKDMHTVKRKKRGSIVEKKRRRK